jgi:hypothetical protein
MPAPRFCTRASRAATEHVYMDIVAVLLGVLMFAILLALVAGIERI